MTLEIINDADKLIGKLAGRLDTAAAPQFAKDMQPLMEQADKQIYLDCSQLQFISSSGLRLFLSLRKATMAQGGNVTITGVNDEIKQVFTITGFSSLFTFA